LPDAARHDVPADAPRPFAAGRDAMGMAAEAGMTLDAVFRLHARYRPEKVAIIDGPRRISFAALDAQIDGAAQVLAGLGVRRGEIVGVALRDHAEHLIGLLALARLGGVVLPMDPRWPVAEKRNVALQFGAAHVLLEADDAAAGAAGWHALPEDWAGTCHTPWHDPAVTPDSPFVLSLSSGTTGRPKGPLTSHRRFENRFLSTGSTLG
jgi:acyl-CoA synthetase (AMP-forming)/AMP-acid ligase II